MKILNLMQCTELGGMEQASLRLMLGLKERGHSCEVVSLNPVGALGSLLERNGIPAAGLDYRGRGGWRTLPSLWRALRRLEGDALIMTGHHLLTMLVLGSLCRGRRVLAIHFHHSGVKPPWQWRLIYRVACSRFQAVTFPSEFIRKEAQELYPPLAAISHLVRNPLAVPAPATPEERRAARGALGVPEGRPVVGNAGWLIPRKRFDVFLQVARQVSLRFPEAIFLIAGDGAHRVRLEAFARELGVAGQVRFLGWREDLAPFYRCLDVLVFNSDWDAMGLTPLEAMSHGVPLVASVQNGGLHEVVVDPCCGFLGQTHDVALLTRQVVTLLRDPELARGIGEAGRQRVAQLSSPQLLAAQVEALLSGGRQEDREAQ